MATDVAVLRKYPDLAESLERGYTLPAEWYTSPEVFELEKARIFHRCWQYVGYTEQVARPGEFFTCRTGDVPIVVVRDGEGVLRAFANVCRHRGSELVLDAAGNRKTIQCHYHGWTWNLDGSLRNAPRSQEQPDFQREDFPLVPLKLETWGPMIFVNPDPLAGPLSGMLQELPGIVEGTGIDLGALQFRVRREYTIAANWKVVAENYNECYHCPIAHPSFSDLIDIDNYRVVTTHEFFSTQHGGVTDAAREGKQTGSYTINQDVLNAGIKEGCYSLIWPNATIDISPGPGNLVTGLFLPIDVGHTLAVMDCFFVPDVPDSDAEAMVEFQNQVQTEDIVLCESVQRGLRSGFYQQGKLLVARENGIQHFQRLVYRFLSA